MKYFVVLLFSFISYTAFGQSDTLEIELNVPAVISALNSTPHEINVGVGQISKSEQLIYLPIKSGELKAFKLLAYDMLPASLSKEIKTYYGHMVDDPEVTCRLTVANGQISASIVTASESIAIEKNKQSSSQNAYWVYEAIQTPAECEIERQVQKQIDTPTDGNTIMFNSHGTQLRTYRLALIVTNTLYTAGGGTDASVNAYVATIVNNVNGIFEKEIAVRFALVSPNNPISTNVFYNYGNGSTDLDAIRPEVLNRFGVANFDVGHCIRSSGGGEAFLGVVCSPTSKGGGLSGVSPSSILIFAHELGHQFDADHTFNGNGSGNCGPDNRGDNDAYEPGSGNTIMSYANICDPESYNLVGGKVPYFHTRSQTTMINHIVTRPAGCGVISNTNNAAPVVAALTPVSIPKNTPFSLSGSATDANGDALSYTWEQYDLAAVSDTGSLGNTANTVGTIAVNSTTAPLFRTRQSTSGTRTFPDISFVLNNANNPPDQVGEDLPNVGRTMKFRLTARDNKAGGGGVAFKEVQVTVNGTAGPLQVSSFNAATTIAAGSQQTITWNVNNTNAISGNVKISLSVDGGQTFPYILLASTPNDGSQQVTIPANVVATNNGRVKVSSLHHPTAEFFDFNNASITITSTCLAVGNSICPSNAVSANQGDASLNLNIAGIYSNPVANNTINLNFAGQVTRQFLRNDAGAGGCSVAASLTSIIIPFQVSTTGAYTISAATIDAFITQNSQTVSCANFVGSNATLNPATNFTNYDGEFTVNLNACTTYYLFAHDWQNLTNTTTTITGPGSISQILNAPAGFSYTYAAVNKATSRVAAISSSADFRSLGGGSYEVFGLAYANGVNTSSFVNLTLPQAYGTGSCILFSSNSKSMNIVGGPCPTSITLTKPANNITSGVVKHETSGILTATNAITGGNVKYDAGRNIQLNPGFTVSNGVVFSAYIDGCGGQ